MKVRRFFLEFKKSAYNGDNLVIPSNIKIFLEKNKDININKFFYKQIGKDHFWRDRLLWTDEEWNSYVNNKNLETWVMKIDGNLVRFLEPWHGEGRGEKSPVVGRGRGGEGTTREGSAATVPSGPSRAAHLCSSCAGTVCTPPTIICLAPLSRRS